MTPQATSVEIPVLQLQNGRFTAAKPAVIIESELRIIVNGRQLATASLLPGMEEEFVTGYLFGQGFIKAPEDIASIIVEGSSAEVTLADKTVPFPASTRYRIVSGGGRTAFTDDRLPQIHSDLTLQKDVVFQAMNRLFDMGAMYKETEGAHAAGIFTPAAEPVCIIEDIGRHNCLDKAIGYALLQNIRCSRHFLVSTGRMASEMVAKLCRGRVSRGRHQDGRDRQGTGDGTCLLYDTHRLCPRYRHENSHGHDGTHHRGTSDENLHRRRTDNQ